EAVPLLERALALRIKSGMGPSHVAEARYGLVEGLGFNRKQRARAIAEAKTALTEYQKANQTEGITQVRAWLAAHR
ncbi:MAG: hypothetical protein H0T79_09700, partial [Deltaproteobacteria bacterium]|nr:hypothetical protein [Deltaproteobacteria bacterium]